MAVFRNMASLHFLSLLMVFYNVVSSQIICPTKTYSPADGVIYLPVDNSMTTLPKNFNCNYKFNIPAGFVAKITANTKMAVGDVLSYTNSLGATNTLPNPISNYVRFVTFPSGSLNVATKFETSSFSAKLEFVDVRNTYTQTVLSTGNYVALNDLRKKSYVTFNSKKVNEKIRLDIAAPTNNITDSTWDQVFVFQGNNLNGNFLGGLTNFTTGPPGIPISIVNFYATSTPSYVVANDESALAKFSLYKAYVIEGPSRGSFRSSVAKPAAYTFISSTSNVVFLESLDFDSFHTITNLGYVSFQSLAPTSSNFETLRYDAQSFTTNSLPQQIPTNFFTMLVSQSGIRLSFDSNSDGYTKISDQRNGYVFSPSYWADTGSAVSYTFSDKTNNYKFTTLVDYLSLKNGDSLDITVKKGSSVVNDKNYTSSITGGSVQTGTGDSLTISANGKNPASAVKVYFKAERTQGSASSTGYLVVLLTGFFYAITC
ncbi:unnamed protein product [Caenorhabditis auriculariae]|uniref:CUB-like domain-containing protein n=1 Tax=Caenorhabditis auriculariae TaxID=2777116 RepID=A0A8S1HZF4_9PELO|nr:unnamed protein product [Caenorhabditis auriculariae]